LVGLYFWAKLKDEYTVTYDPYTATTGTISNSLSFSGSLSLIDNKTYTAESSGTVRTIYISAGDKVEEGDKLVRLSSGGTVTADFAGTVNAVNVEEGDEVGSGDSLVQVADFEHMQVSFRVDEYDIGEVQVGDAVTVTATATEQTFESSVATINYISASSGNVAYYTATAKVEIPDDSGVYPGMQVTVSIPQEEAVDVVILKEDALSFTAENQAFVYVMNDDGTLSEQTVEVGVSNGNYVEIKSGISSGDTVYTVSEVEEDTMNSLLSGLFGTQQVNGGGMPDMGGGGNMPGGDFDFSNADFGGGERPSGGGPGGNGGGN